MSVAYRGVDPDPGPNEGDWEAIGDYLPRLQKNTAAHAEMTVDYDGDADGIDVAIRFTNIPLEDFVNVLEDRIYALYEAMVRS